MIRWFRQYVAISKNAFVVSISDPVCLILMLCVLTLMLFLGALPTFNFGEELRLIRDQSMALLFIGGCLTAMLTTMSTMVRDLRMGAISVLMSRPVSSFGVIAGKWTGLAGALLVYHIPASTACLWITKIAGGETAGTQHLDKTALFIYMAAIIGPLALMGLRHYLFGGWYVWQACIALLIAFPGAFLLGNFLGHTGGDVHWGAGVDWRTLSGCILLVIAELIFLALIMPVAVRAGGPTLMGVAIVLFFFGMISNYVATLLFDQGWVQTAGKALVPNWQAFWISDQLAEKGAFAWSAVARYTLHASLHAAAYVGVCLCIAAILFNNREFSGDDNL